MRYSLKQIEVFLKTAQCQNLTRAASELAMSQSAASESLKALEQQFDINLFDRIGKRLQLNDFGRLIQKEAVLLLEQAKALENALLRHDDMGSIKIGATLTIGNYLAINMISDFRSQHPGANATLEVANTTQIAHKIRDFELDVGLIEGEVSDPELDVSVWRDDELVVFCSPEHPYAGLGTLTDKELLEACWVLREHGSGTRQAFDHAMHGLISQLDITLELQHTEAIKRAVEANMGLGCLSRVALQESFKRGTLVPLNVPHRDFKRKFYIILRKGKYLSSSIQRWLQLCDAYLHH
ncbi:MAG: LysR family transcriptional regulator [Oleiphilus sp.]|nr:MAG: LysR family transcriptional regulator [Oleiphilus sp.]